MLALVILIAGISLRLAPHSPNFTPVAALALFSGVYLSRKQAFIIPLLLMMLSDIVLGLHDVVLFTWGSFALITLIGTVLKNKVTFSRTISTGLISSLLFYLITNFGVWLAGWYTHDLKGLITCYMMALPYLRDFTMGTLLYSAVFFGAYELIARLVKNTKLAPVLLKK